MKGLTGSGVEICSGGTMDGRSTQKAMEVRAAVVLAVLLSGCVFDGASSCSDQTCTLILKNISVGIVDAGGRSVSDAETRTVYAPTGAILRHEFGTASGYYVVI